MKDLLGVHCLVFPEGTRRLPTDPVTFKRGAELLYAKLGVPVLTVALNSGHFWSPGDACKRKGTIMVSHGELFPAGLSGAEFTRRAERILEADKNRLFRWVDQGPFRRHGVEQVVSHRSAAG
jgi:1-acyl-sn-glycerol-3-phosphate acyltransferase